MLVCHFLCVFHHWNCLITFYQIKIKQKQGCLELWNEGRFQLEAFGKGEGVQQPGRQLCSCRPDRSSESEHFKHQSAIALHALCGCPSFILIGLKSWMVRCYLRWQERFYPRFQTKMDNGKGSGSGGLTGPLASCWRGKKQPCCLQQPYKGTDTSELSGAWLNAGRSGSAEDRAWDVVLRASGSIMTGWQLKRNTCPALEWVLEHQNLGGLQWRPESGSGYKSWNSRTSLPEPPYNWGESSRLMKRVKVLSWSSHSPPKPLYKSITSRIPLKQSFF